MRRTFAEEFEEEIEENLDSSSEKGIYFSLSYKEVCFFREDNKIKVCFPLMKLRRPRTRMCC